METNAVFAYACAELRPQWDGTKVSSFQEAMVLATAPISLGLLTLTLVALWLRKLWLTILICTAWAAWSFHIIFDDIMNRAVFTSQKIGCVGTSTAYLAFIYALCVFLLALTLVHKRNASTSGTRT